LEFDYWLFVRIIRLYQNGINISDVSPSGEPAFSKVSMNSGIETGRRKIFQSVPAMKSVGGGL